MTNEDGDLWGGWCTPPQLMKRVPPGGMLASGRNNGYLLNSTSHPACTYTHHYRAERGHLSGNKKGDGGIDQDKFVSLRYLDGSICQPTHKSTKRCKERRDKEGYVEGNKGETWQRNT